MGKKVLYLTDYPAKGSGYASISKPICNGLVDAGHEVKMIAISNKGEEHWEKFSIIPVASVQESTAAIHNICFLWKPDVVIVALDIPLQEQAYAQIEKLGVKYICITPMENGPLLQSWAVSLMKMDDVFFISALGKQEALKAGVEKAKHLHIGLDVSLWYPAAPGEREIVRKNLGFEPGDTIILTVADNQERKNLWGGMQIVSNMKYDNPELNVKYVLVTREHSPYGYKLQELAYSMGLQSDISIYERGMPEQQLRLLYIACDAFLLPSKGEGFGFPVAEALMCGCKCVATDTGALHELLSDGEGWLVPSEYEFIDVWGNSLRSMIDRVVGARMLKEAVDDCEFHTHKIVAQSIMIEQIRKSVEEVTNG
jgi:glycosyltransferase involved in cell wall biosynthesis